MKRQQTGFTMIELIVVIIILGILAAVALPRFTNLQRDARIAKLNAARGSALAAMAMVYGSAQARAGTAQPACPAGGTPILNAAGTGTICTDKGLVNVTNYYPSANLGGIVAATGLVPGAGVPTAATLATEGYAFAAGQIRVLGGPNPAQCNIAYTAATATAAATFAAPVTTGC